MKQIPKKFIFKLMFNQIRSFHEIFEDMKIKKNKIKPWYAVLRISRTDSAFTSRNDKWLIQFFNIFIKLTAWD